MRIMNKAVEPIDSTRAKLGRVFSRNDSLVFSLTLGPRHDSEAGIKPMITTVLASACVVDALVVSKMQSRTSVFYQGYGSSVHSILNLNRRTSHWKGSNSIGSKLSFESLLAFRRPIS